MSDYRWVDVERGDDGLRVLSLNKPPVNALGREMVADLTRAAGELAADDDARCLVLRTAGQHFCAGADLKERQTMTVDDVRADLFMEQRATRWNYQSDGRYDCEGWERFRGHAVWAVRLIRHKLFGEPRPE